LEIILDRHGGQWFKVDEKLLMKRSLMRLGYAKSKKIGLDLWMVPVQKNL